MANTINNKDNKKSGHHGGVVLVLFSVEIVLHMFVKLLSRNLNY
jgi:hypothetical protein